MQKTNTGRRRQFFDFFSLAGSIVLVAVTMGNAGVATADAYLDALQQEANQLPYLQGGKKSTATQNTAVTSTVNLSEFEKNLANKLPAAASIYKKLTTEQRLRVFNAYKATRDYHKTELTIHEIYLSR